MTTLTNGQSESHGSHGSSAKNVDYVYSYLMVQFIIMPYLQIYVLILQIYVPKVS